VLTSSFSYSFEHLQFVFKFSAGMTSNKMGRKVQNNQP